MTSQLFHYDLTNNQLIIVLQTICFERNCLLLTFGKVILVINFELVFYFTFM